MPCTRRTASRFYKWKINSPSPVTATVMRSIIFLLFGLHLIGCGARDSPPQPDDAAVLRSVCTWLDAHIDEHLPPLMRLQMLTESGELEPEDPTVERCFLVLPVSFKAISTDQLTADLDECDDIHLKSLIASIGNRNLHEQTLPPDILPSSFHYAPTDRDTPLNYSFREENPEIQGWLGLYMPGYNEAGDVALVRVLFGPTAHGACWYFVLEQIDGRWTVTWQSNTYYA